MTLIDLGGGRLELEDGCPRCEREIVLGSPNHTVTAGPVGKASVRPNVVCQCGAELDIQQGRAWYRGQVNFPPERDVRVVSENLPDRVAAPITFEIQDHEGPDEVAPPSMEGPESGTGGSEEESEPPSDTAVLPAWIGETADGSPCDLCVDRFEDPDKPSEPCTHHEE